jgi:hypothetical protein
MDTVFWSIEIAILCVAALATWHWRSNPPVATSIGLVMLGIILIVSYECLFFEGPFRVFEAPFNPVVVARRAVEAAGGELDVVKPDTDFVEITFTGHRIDDKVLETMIPYVKDLSEVYLHLENTSVTCAGAQRFERSMIDCKVFGLPPGCDGLEREKTGQNVRTIIPAPREVFVDGPAA